MEALLSTVALGLVIAGVLVVLARSWPRSSRLGGYRTRSAARPGERQPEAEHRGEAPREDDDVRWRWSGPRDD